jgi:hypothetical protein
LARFNLIIDALSWSEIDERQFIHTGVYGLGLDKPQAPTDHFNALTFPGDER